MEFHPSRSVTLRTRLDVEAVRAAIEPLTAAPKKPGFFDPKAPDPCLGGELGERGFHLRYVVRARRSSRTYAIVGTIEEEPDWRIVRLELRSEASVAWVWLAGGTLLLLAVPAYALERTIALMFALIGVVILMTSIDDLAAMPEEAVSQVSALVASRIRGSVRRGDQWVVP